MQPFRSAYTNSSSSNQSQPTAKRSSNTDDTLNNNHHHHHHQTNGGVGVGIGSTSPSDSSALPTGGELLHFDRLATIEFTSDRKRMSTVLRDRRDGQLWLLTKGAESHVLPLCAAATPPALCAATLQHINEFAALGLRTLAIARRKVSAAEFERYQQQLTLAAGSLGADRRERMDEIDALFEQRLELLGATAVEDALQVRICRID